MYALLMCIAMHINSETLIVTGRFAFTISIGMAVGPHVDIQVQNHMSSKVSFLVSRGKALNVCYPYFYICLVVGMLVSKLSTQIIIDAGKHCVLVYAILAILIVTMASYAFLKTGIHLLIAAFLFGLGYGILQPLFQAFVTETTPAPKRGKILASESVPS